MLIAVVAAAIAGASDWSGRIAGETRFFWDEPSDRRQHGPGLSASLELTYYHEWLKEKQSVTFTPFFRWDQHDAERTHLDIRELYWEKAAETWELRIGINKVFWGVTESQHLVDIINQTDFVEDVDGEEKLGQPMINLALVRKWGTLNLYVLPGFRERTYPGEEGRLRPPFPVAQDDAEYESGARSSHIDWAARWSRSFGAVDIALSHFAGTSREPRFEPRLSLSKGIELVPHYYPINQTGLELQYTGGSWLWKLEGILRSGQGETYTAFTGGFEYTIGGVFGSPVDVGLIGEFLYDDRGTNYQTPFEHDIFVGTRIGFNDKQSTELLLGGIVDVETGATALGLEASRRLGQRWKLSVEGRVFSGFPPDDPAHAFRNDSHLKVELAWYF